MLRNVVIAATCGVFLISAEGGRSLTAASSAGGAAPQTAPCGPILTAPTPTPTTPTAPKPPTNLRVIVSGGGEESSESIHESGPYVSESEAASPVVDTHPYFASLISRSDCHAAYHMRSQEQLDRLETLKSGTSALGEERYPVTYDSVMDAALFRIDPRVGSTDGEHKRVNLGVTSGSMLLTWDLRFDEGHRYKNDGDLIRHKLYMLGWFGTGGSGDNRYLGLHTDYKNATDDGQGIAKLRPYMIGDTWLGPGTTLGSQGRVMPMANEFYIAANTWTRVWIYVEDMGKATSFVSIWAADTGRDPIQLQNRNAIVVPPSGLTKFWFEYDTSAEDATNVEMRSWNRNVVVLKDVTMSTVTSLLKRP